MADLTEQHIPQAAIDALDKELMHFVDFSASLDVDALYTRALQAALPHLQEAMSDNQCDEDWEGCSYADDGIISY